MVKVILRKVSPYSLAKIHALVMGVIGLIAGVVTTISSFIVNISSWAFLSIIIFPLLYMILGFISGLICAWIYNLCSGMIGGLELEMEE